MDSKVPRDNDQLDKHSYINIDGDEKTGNYAKVVSDLYTSFKPISVSGESVTLSSETPTDILVAIDIANGTQVLDEDTLIESRNLVLTVTDANTSISAGTVTITGLDDFGNVITDVLDLTSALTLTTTNLYKSITSVVVEDLADEEAGDTIAIETGTAGLTGKFFIANRGPILSTYGETLGYYKDATHNDTSFAIATGTALTTPVWYDKRKDEAHILLDLGAGEYCIDHINGLVYYKTADDTATTIDYIYPMQKMDVAGVTFSGNVDVYAFKNEAGTQKDAKVNGADILVMQTGSGNDATAMNKEIATENTLALLEGKDFATETTLASVLTDTNTLAAIDYAVESGGNLDTISSNTTTLAAVDFATESTAGDILNALTLDEKEYDTIELTYVAPGNNGAGEVETVIYKDGTTPLYTLTLTYNSDNKLESVVRS